MTKLRTSFSPYNVLNLYVLGFVLYSLGLANNLAEPTVYFFIFSACAIGASYLGVFIGLHIYKSKSVTPITTTPIRKTSRKKRITIITLYCGTLSFFIFEFIYFYLRYGNIPILLPDFEVSRFDFSYNGYVHMIALCSSTFLTLLLCDLATFHKQYSVRYRTLIIAFSLISSTLVLMQGNRGELLKIFAPALIFYTLINKTKLNNPKLIGLVFIVLIFAFGAFKYYRDLMYFGDHLNQTIDNNWVLGCSESNPLSCSLFFSYLALAMNYGILSTYITSITEHTYGYFTLIHPIYSLLPGDQFNLISYQKDVLGVDFYGFLTPTIYGVPFIDYGWLTPLFCIPLFMLIGFLFRQAKESNRLSHGFFYSVVCWYFVLGAYTYPFTEFYVIFNIGITFVFSKIIFQKKTLTLQI